MAKKYKDIEIGDEYGRWTVIEKGKLVKKKKGSRQYWICKCSCEKQTIREVDGYGLLNGSSKSCGCISLEILENKDPHNKVHKDIEINDVFGRWKVIDKSDKTTKRGVHYWLCECSCEKHTKREIISESLKNGRSKSCGCTQKESMVKSGLEHRKYNIQIGDKYDNWTVIDNGKPIGNLVNTYLCECDCKHHTKKNFRADDLIKKHDGCIKCFNVNDLSGRIFGKLLVLNKNEEWSKIYGCTTYDCKCSCGNPIIKHIRHASLITGNINSCGCIAKEVENLVGQTFGQLTVLKFIKKRYSKNTSVNLWECKCSCGKTVIKTQNNLKNGNSRSCGCLKKSKGAVIIEKMLNDWGIIFKEEHRFKDCRYKNTLPFDFVIYDSNNKIICAIEYDGQQHFKPTTFGHFTQEKAELNYLQNKIRDNIKTEYCKLNKIKLIRIPYWEKDNINYIIFEELVKLKIIEEIKIA
jgi:hypothetical protein